MIHNSVQLFLCGP